MKYSYFYKFINLKTVRYTFFSKKVLNDNNLPSVFTRLAEGYTNII